MLKKEKGIKNVIKNIWQKKYLIRFLKIKMEKYLLCQKKKI